MTSNESSSFLRRSIASSMIVPGLPFGSVACGTADITASSSTTMEYVEMAPRLIESLKTEYAVDEDRVYGTGQSMGCMTVMALAASRS